MTWLTLFSTLSAYLQDEVLHLMSVRKDTHEDDPESVTSEDCEETLSNLHQILEEVLSTTESSLAECPRNERKGFQDLRKEILRVQVADGQYSALSEAQAKEQCANGVNVKMSQFLKLDGKLYEWVRHHE